MHRGQLGHGSTLHKQVERLWLIDKITTLARHVDDVFHAQFPCGFIQLFDIVRDIVELLNRAIGTHQFLLEIFIPETQVDEVFQQVFVHDYKLTGQHSSSIDIGCIGFKAFVISEDLGGWSSWHWCHEQGVANTMLFDLFSKRNPIPSATELTVFDSPKVVLELPFWNGWSFITFIGSFVFCHVFGGGHSCEIKRFKNLLVEFFGFVWRKGHTQLDKGIG